MHSMGNRDGPGRRTSLPPELDAIDSGWDEDEQVTVNLSQKRQTEEEDSFASDEPPTVPRDVASTPTTPSTGQRHADRQSARTQPEWRSKRATPTAPERISERVTAPPPHGLDSELIDRSRPSVHAREAQTEPPAASPSPSENPDATNGGFSDEEEDDDIFDRPTLDITSGHHELGEFPHPDGEQPTSLKPNLDDRVTPAIHPSQVPTAPPPNQPTGKSFPSAPPPESPPVPMLGREFSERDTPTTPRQVALETPSLLPVEKKNDSSEGVSISGADERALSREMHERFAMGDFSGALQKAEEALAQDGTDREAEELARKCREVLAEMYSSRIAGLERTARVVMTPDQVQWLSLDHRTGFLLSMIDGESSVEDLLDVCGMPRLEGLKIICNLLDENVIELD